MRYLILCFFASSLTAVSTVFACERSSFAAINGSRRSVSGSSAKEVRFFFSSVVFGIQKLCHFVVTLFLKFGSWTEKVNTKTVSFNTNNKILIETLTVP